MSDNYALLAKLKASFSCGKTRPADYRLFQITQLEVFLLEKRVLLVEAMIADFKCRYEAEHEFISCFKTVADAKENLLAWMRPAKKKTSLG